MYPCHSQRLCVRIHVHILLFLSLTSYSDAVISGGVIMMNEKFEVFEDLGIQKGMGLSFSAYSN